MNANKTVILVLIAVVGFALWWVLFPKGLSILPNSYVDKPNGFAVNPPAEWVTLTPDNYRTIVESVGPGFPQNLRNMFQNPDTAVGFVKVMSRGVFGPSVNVVMLKLKGRLPPINERSKIEAAQAISAGMSSLLSGYKQESVDIIEVDLIRSLSIVHSGGMFFDFAAVPGGEGEYARGGTLNLKLRFRQVFVPAGKNSYIITCAGTTEQYAELVGEFERVIDSFRVMKRPGRFGPVIQGGVVGGLVGMLIYLLGALVKGFSGSSHE